MENCNRNEVGLTMNSIHGYRILVTGEWCYRPTVLWWLVREIFPKRWRRIWWVVNYVCIVDCRVLCRNL